MNVVIGEFIDYTCVIRTLCANDANIEALYHVLILMILVGLGYSLLKDTVEAGRYAWLLCNRCFNLLSFISCFVMCFQ